MNKLLLQLIITIITSSVICMILIPLIIQASLKFNLVDKPDERKVHIKPIPRLAGVGIFISTIMGIIVSGQGLEAIAMRKTPVHIADMLCRCFSIYRCPSHFFIRYFWRT